MLADYPFRLEREDSGLHAPEFTSCEIEFLRILGWLIVARNYKRLLEIGTYKGQATWILDRLAAQTEGHLITVDPHPIVLAQGFEQERYPHTTFVSKRSLDFFDLHDPKELFDFVFVDGDHTRVACYEDVRMAALHLNPGGAIAIHDTNYMPGVQDAMRDLEVFWPPSAWTHLRFGKGLSILEPHARARATV